MLVLFSCFNPSITISRIHPASFEFKEKKSKLFILSYTRPVLCCSGNCVGALRSLLLLFTFSAWLLATAKVG